MHSESYKKNWLGSMVLVRHFALGIALRLAIFAYPEVVDTLGARLELSTALTRYSEVEQEARWPSAEGAHRPPLITFLVKSGFATSLFFVAVDCAIAVCLYISLSIHGKANRTVREHEKGLITRWKDSGRPRLGSQNDDPSIELGKDEDETWSATTIADEPEDLSSDKLPETIATLYLLSPFSILTCGARSFAPLTFLCALAAITSAQLNIASFAGFFLACVCYLDGPSYLAILSFPVLIRSYHAVGSRVVALLSFVGTLSALTYVSYSMEGQSWRFLRPVYFWVLSVPDFRPNVGMWWYLMAEMFERYRGYFLFVLHSFIYVVATPLAVYLRHRPVIHAHFGLAILQLFQPYPELFHIFTSILLVLAHPQFTLLIPLLAPTLLLTCFSLVMQPLMLYTWLDLGSGNANYYYFQCLIVNWTVAGILLYFFFSVVSRDIVLRRIERWLIKQERKA